jgi:spectinomycin phosphotransferase
MLTKPGIEDEVIIRCLQQEYGLPVEWVEFLPLGADLNTAVYRAAAQDVGSYFVKLRSGVFDETSVMLPKWLSDNGIPHIIAPLTTLHAQLWTQVEKYTLISYPFITGQDGYAVPLTDEHWRAFGATLRQIHTAQVPGTIHRRIPLERYSGHARATVAQFISRLELEVHGDDVAQETVAFLAKKRDMIEKLVHRTERLAQELQSQPPALVVCHSDLHAGNLHMTASGKWYIVDWDDPILAPKERDLMYAGGGQGFIGHTPQEEEALFYEGYGPVPVNASALTYYRCERVVQDIAIYCEQLLQSSEGGEDRQQSLHYLKSNFLPGGTLELAFKS